MLTPELTYTTLLVVQALHLLHHRLAKRHISFTEVVSAAVLCIPPSIALVPGIVLIGVHLLLIGIQIIGSVFIQRLSPTWKETA